MYNLIGYLFIPILSYLHEENYIAAAPSNNYVYKNSDNTTLKQAK